MILHRPGLGMHVMFPQLGTASASAPGTPIAVSRATNR